MTHSLRACLVTVVLAVSGSAVHADDGWQLLFAGHAQGLSGADQQAIYRQLGLMRSADGRELLVMGGEAAGPARFTVQLQDINADGRVEVFVSGGNAFLSGETGSSVWLFTQPVPDGRWQMDLGFPAVSWTVLAESHAGYPDLRFTGYGSCDAVWRWDGTAYEHHQDVPIRPGGCDSLP
jgi:hypothetical protein